MAFDKKMAAPRALSVLGIASGRVLETSNLENRKKKLDEALFSRLQQIQVLRIRPLKAVQTVDEKFLLKTILNAPCFKLGRLQLTKRFWRRLNLRRRKEREASSGRRRTF